MKNKKGRDMSVTSKLEAAQNELLNPVLIELLKAGRSKIELLKAGRSELVSGQKTLEPEQRQAALLVAGILTSIKVLVMQAVKLIDEAELDDLVD